MKKRHSWKRKLVAGVCAVALAAGMTGCSASDTQGEESAANSSTAANDAAATPATKELHAGSTTYFYAESMDPAGAASPIGNNVSAKNFEARYEPGTRRQMIAIILWMNPM